MNSSICLFPFPFDLSFNIWQNKIFLEILDMGSAHSEINLDSVGKI